MAKRAIKKNLVTPEVAKQKITKEKIQKIFLHIRTFIPKELQTPFAIIIFSLVCLFLFLKLLGPITFLTENKQNKDNLFQVQGTGKITTIPNSAKFVFGVSKTAATVPEAQKQTNDVINHITGQIKSSDSATREMKTINYSVFPQYDYESGQQTPTGYTVTQDIEIKVTPLNKINKIIDIATTNGANQIGGIAFTFDDITRKSLEEKARKQAIQNAKEKAQQLAKDTGIHLGKIIDIKEEPVNESQPIPFTANAINSENEKTFTQLPNGENTVSLSVTIYYEKE